MSDMAINQVLAQMRTLKAQAQGVEAQESSQQQKVADFGDVLKNAVESVNEQQQKAGDLKTKFELGDPNVSLAEVMVTSQKANVSFQAVVQVRNKLIDAYKDVMNMPI